MSITNVLSEIIALDRETAIYELSLLKQHIDVAEFRAAAKLLPSHYKVILADISKSEVNRRKISTYQGFKLGDRVQMKFTTRIKRQISRGRLRQPNSKRRVLERRIGQCKQSIGWATSKGSRKLFYISRLDRDRDLGSTLICPHSSLLGVELTISEFNPPWVYCYRSSNDPEVRPIGSYAPGLLAEELTFSKSN